MGFMDHMDVGAYGCTVGRWCMCRVRIEAAMALGQTAGRSTHWSGLDHLLKMYRTRAFDSELEAPRPWQFADLAEHYVNQVATSMPFQHCICLCQALVMIRIRSTSHRTIQSLHYGTS
jgi:hypothetical protein